jgi:hypothetical protein
MTKKDYGELTISQIDKELGNIYRAFKVENGGKKTSANGKYGFKSIQFIFRPKDRPERGPYFGRGSCLSAFRNEFPKGTAEGTEFIAQEIFKPKAKEKIPTVDAEHILVLAGKKVKA